MNKESENKKDLAWYRYPYAWLRSLYKWVLHWADTKYSVPALVGIAFAESSFFPIPPDVLLMAMALGKPKKAFYYAFICSVGSIIGGLFGYFIGYYLWHLVHGIFIPHIFSQELFELVRHKYELYSFMIVFIAAFTPIPYKVFTIAGGVCGINIAGFLAASIIGRSLRFFLVAGTFFFFGERMKKFISRYFEWLTILFALLLILGFMLTKHMLK